MHYGRVTVFVSVCCVLVSNAFQNFSGFAFVYLLMFVLLAAFGCLLIV